MIGSTFLTQTLVVQRASDGTVDDRGIPAQTWSTHLTVAGSSQPLSVREVAQLSQAGPVVATHKVFVPGSEDIVEGDRIVDGTRTFQVDGVTDPAGAGHHLEILAHAVTDA